METERTSVGTWQGRNVLFMGDSLTARRIYPETVKEILGIHPFYHCKGGVGLKAMVDGDRGLGGDYDNETDAVGVLRPLSIKDVENMDLIVFYGGYNNRRLEIGKVGDRYVSGGAGQKTVAGVMQYCIDRIYQTLFEANNTTCRLLIVTVDCSGKYPWVDADGYTEVEPGSGKTLEAMANIQKAVAAYNSIPCCDLFHNSGINRYTWNIFSAESFAHHPNFSPYLIDEYGNPLDNVRIRYETGKSYYQHRGGKVVSEVYTGKAPYPYNGDQVHKSLAGYKRIGELIAGAIITAYGN
ncbi:MAG: hypothetical protein IJW55_00595 [Clostridia bacterium]|nr:hypothetical protein [Clostridia bacterium]